MAQGLENIAQVFDDINRFIEGVQKVEDFLNRVGGGELGAQQNAAAGQFLTSTSAGIGQGLTQNPIAGAIQRVVVELDLKNDMLDAKIRQTSGDVVADTLDKVNPKHLKDAAMVLAQSLVHLANEDGPIAERTHVDEIVRKLEESGTAETLRVQLKWHPDSIR